jgi:putative zinc finger/helix-turn-helix YgiT family protein
MSEDMSKKAAKGKAEESREERCSKCGSPMHVKAKATHRYTECGLSNIVLVGVVVRRCPKCGNRSVVIPKVAQLHRKLAQGLAEQSQRLAAEEIRFLRKYLGWSGADFAQFFGVTPETVSRWENGSKSMSATSERLLRLCVLKFEPVEDYSILREMATEKHSARPIRMAITNDWQPAA